MKSRRRRTSASPQKYECIKLWSRQYFITQRNSDTQESQEGTKEKAKSFSYVCIEKDLRYNVEIPRTESGYNERAKCRFYFPRCVCPCKTMVSTIKSIPTFWPQYFAGSRADWSSEYIARRGGVLFSYWASISLLESENSPDGFMNQFSSVWLQHLSLQQWFCRKTIHVVSLTVVPWRLQHHTGESETDS